MRARFDVDRAVYLLLIAFVGAVTAVDSLLPDQVVRLASVAALAPFTAGALLSMRRTAVVCGLYAVLTTVQYGLWQPGVSGPNRAAIISSALAICVVSLAVCRVRLGREERIRHLGLTASAAQRLLLRSLPLPAGNLLVDGFYVAAEKETLVGGDIYEVLSTPYGTRMVIGDVRGKGLAAIGASAAVLTAFREAAYQEPVLDNVVDRMEQALERYERAAGAEPDEEFVTALVIETLGPESLRVIDCGHLNPYLITRGEITEIPIRDPGLPLGLGGLVAEPRHWQDIKVPTDARLLICTDGILEARSPKGAYYPLDDALQRWHDLPTTDLLARLRTDLTRHTGGALRDDAALLVIQR